MTLDRSTPAAVTDDAHALSPQRVADALASNVTTGLAAQDAEARLARYGPNAVEASERFSVLRTLRHQLADPLIVLLALAAGLAGALGERLDAVMILVIVGLNLALGFFQEWRAERALAALAGLLAPHCTVLRGGRRRRVETRELVPGDLVVLSRGERVPADLKLVQGESLLLDESALTGESHGVAKAPGRDLPAAPLHARQSIAYAGSLVLDGHGAGIAIATGAATEFGSVAALAASVQRQPTPLQKRLSRLSLTLGFLALGAAVAVTGLGVLTGRPLLDMVFTGVSLAVAAVPEGLPAVVALSLALGVRTMARRNALVRRLRAAEALGSATVICTDKTGTLTSGEMVAVRTVTAAGTVLLGDAGGEPDELAIRALRTAGWCNDAELTGDGAVGEPTERALLAAAQRFAGVGEDAPERVAEQPFSAARKRMLVVVERNGTFEAHMKGAPDFVLPLCARVAAPDGAQPLDDAGRRAWIERADAMGEDGLRVLAVACRETDAAPSGDIAHLESDLVFLGLIGLMDPPRPRARPAVEAAREAGIRILMITGDGAGTARAIAREVGLQAEDVLSGAEIDTMDDAVLLARLEAGPVLSRTTPEHKLRVVRLLQEAGEIVAMTGDGVNDAPALKQSDIGIAMGVRGVDAAKAAADLVLLDDDFGTIVDAIREGRRQDDSIRNFTRFLLASNFGEVLAVAASVASAAPLILTPVQLLWINLVTDGPMALALGVERAGPDVMRRPPRRPGAPVLDRVTLAIVAAFGLWIAAASLLVFRLTLPLGVEAGQTGAFSAVVVMSATAVFAFRSLDTPLIELDFAANPWLPASVVATLGLQLALVYVPALRHAMGLAPLPAWVWAVILAAAVPLLLVPELIKIARTRRLAQRREEAQGPASAREGKDAG
ncbi:cation-transporting P-type ATPase [Marinicauda algicola]|uniref:Cation-transporting P-type ATPase n=1 Tax=Marinicauda algicola TaxID=2029849 RepID=A0A4S2H384_9PROT|nr:cation-transporting P-type ATPase [Marinicauda algicola]TGY89811.1 cation-transporting P-type ATPase [Marinicauda algicola]